MTEYLINRTEYTTKVEKPKNDPNNAWTLPFVTGHKYKFSLGEVGLDFTTLNIELSDVWKEDDKSVILVHNFTDQRHEVNITVDGVQTFLNNSIDNNNLTVGQYVVYNDSEIRADKMQQMHIVLNGKGQKKFTRRNLFINTARCIGPCLTGLVN